MATQPTETQQHLQPIQSPPPPITVGGKQLPAALKPLESLINANGEIDFDGVSWGERIQKYMDFEQNCNFNLVNFAENILSQIPPGTKLIPIPVIPTLDDCWHGDAARDMKLKEGHVAPKADFIIKLGNLQGCVLKQNEPKIDHTTGTAMYEVTYNAGFTLPNGTDIFVEGEGKMQELYTTYKNQDGSPKKQAHVSESTKKKARRNAIKNLNKIPTSMEKEKFLRPWILLRPVFTPGVSTETDRLLARQQGFSNDAAKMLYSNPDQPSQAVIDVAVQKESGEVEVTIPYMMEMIREASTEVVLNALSPVLANMRLTTAERKTLSDAFKAQQSLIKGSNS